MKKRLLKILVCPFCRKGLKIQNADYVSGEIKSGTLVCKCKRNYPVINFIPRFVKSDEYVKSFSFEWQTHKTTQLDSVTKRTISLQQFIMRTGFDLNKIRGKFVLDVGCGQGRFSEIAAKAGSEIVGIDLSYAVDAAQANIGHRKNVHLVQADVFNLPFKEQAFDYIFSIGVLHHTPDCEKAFKRLPPLLKKGGKISLWVYDKYALQPVKMSEYWRVITTRLPPNLLHALCYLAVPLYYVYKIPLIGKFLFLIFPIEMRPDWKWRVLNTFDWYSPKYQSKHTDYELFTWFSKSGLHDIKVLEVPASMQGTK